MKLSATSGVSCSTSFPRPLFLLLLLILLLLLEDAGAQQGEFFPRSALLAGPRGPWGAVGASGMQGVRVVRESADAQGTCGALRCLARPGPALAALNCKAWLSVFPQVGAALLLGEPIHFF